MALLSNKHTNNILFTSVPGILSIFLTFFTIPIFINLISRDLYANYLIQHFILTLGMIFNFQLGKIASIKLQNLNKKLKKELIFMTIFYVSIIGLCSSIVIYLILYLFFEHLEFFDLNVSIIFGLFFTILYITLEYIVRGIKGFKSTSLTNLLFYSISISFPGILILFKDYNDYIINNLFNISVLIKFFSLIVLFYILFKENYFSKIKLNFFFKKIFIFHSKWMTLNAFYNQVYEYFDKYIIKLSIGSTMLINYSISQQIAAKMTIFSNAIISVILPKLSRKSKPEEKKKIFTANFYMFYFLTTTFIIIIIPFYEIVLRWWLNEGYNGEISKLFIIFLALTFLGSCSNIIISLYEANSIEKKNTMLESIIFFPFLIALITGIYFKNIFFFAIILLIKEFILLFARIIQIRKFIYNFKFLIIQNFLFTSVLTFNLVDLNILSSLATLLMIIVFLLMKPFKFFKKEFISK